jgi:hypothetical protein
LDIKTQLDNIEITKEWVQSLIDKEKERMAKPLCEPYDLSDFKYKDYVRELTSPLDLKVEGSVMGHCVGGYSNALEDGRSRIFHIEVDGIGSTLELGVCKDNTNNVWRNIDFGIDPKPTLPDYEQEFNIKQHYGRYPEKGNKRPTNKNRGIAFKLAYFLAQEHMIEETRKRVEDSVKTDIESREGRKRIAEAEAAKSRYEKVEVTV